MSQSSSQRHTYNTYVPTGGQTPTLLIAGNINKHQIQLIRKALHRILKTVTSVNLVSII